MSSPFAFADGGFPGSAPAMPVTPARLLQSRRLWLGRPGNMIELPSPPQDGYQPTPTHGETGHTLITGATAVTYFADRMRSWAISWPALEARDLSVLDAFYDRIPAAAGGPGNGPWAFANPEGRNRLTRQQSLCGAVDGTTSDWYATGSGGTLTVAAQQPVVTPCGVLEWTPAAAGSRLYPSPSNVPDALRAAPNVPGEPVTAFFWAWTASGSTTARTLLAGKNAGSNADVVTVNGPDLTVTTTPTLLWCAAPPGAFGTTQYVMPALRASGTTALRTSNPMLSYTDCVLDWAVGQGVPRVVWPAAPGAQGFLSEWDGSAEMTLSESVPGAA